MNIMRRATAMDRNLPRYFTGEPCIRGHTAERYTATKRCVDCNVRDNAIISRPKVPGFVVLRVVIREERIEELLDLVASWK